MQEGDIIIEMNGKKIVSQATLREFLDTLKGGDVITVKAKRKGEMKDFKVTLRPARRQGPRGDFQNEMGAGDFPLSIRAHTGFPLVRYQTDMVVIAAKDCGGPVVDLEGNVLGINIARAGRVETWVLPSEVIMPAAALTSKPVRPPRYPPRPLSLLLPVAPSPHLQRWRSNARAMPDSQNPPHEFVRRISFFTAGDGFHSHRHARVCRRNSPHNRSGSTRIPATLWCARCLFISRAPRLSSENGRECRFQQPLNP